MQVVGRVFDGDAAAEKVLHAVDAFGGVAHAFGGEGQRQQVVKVAAQVLAVAQVVGKETAAVLAHHRFDAGQELHIERGLAAERQRQAVQRQRQALGGGIEALACGAAHADPVFGRGFDKVDGAGGGQIEKVLGQIAAVAEPGAVQGGVHILFSL